MIGIGLRRDFADEFLGEGQLNPDFVELAPENWMNLGGYWKKYLHRIAERYPITSHGLSLSIGSPDKLDFEFLKSLKNFLDEYKIQIYSEHLSFTSCNNAHLYELLPVPFREDAAKHIAAKIKLVQDYLERPFVMENVSYYSSVAPQMTEPEFINLIVSESKCKLLLDVNNVYVNSFNHGYDAKHFIEHMPAENVSYLHMAGHEKVSDDFIIDTHGEAITEAVYELFEFTLSKLKPVPVLLERDFNIPEMSELNKEMSNLKDIRNKIWNPKNELAA